MDGSRRLLILYHSRTDATARLVREAARELRAGGFDLALAPIEPRLPLPYPLWLFLSFIPGVRFPIRPLEEELSHFDGCLLAFPKWTLANPPVNALISVYGKDFPPTALLTVCGGWDELRYLEQYRNALERKGVTVIGQAAFRRGQIGKPQTLPLLKRLLGDWFG